MHHNSFHVRDWLRSLNGHAVVRARRDPHRNVAPRAGAQPDATQFRLDASWAIECATDHPAERLAAEDLRDFLRRLDVAVESPSPRRIALSIEEAAALQGGFCLCAELERITLRAVDARALWAGLVHLENEMRAAGGPILRRGETRREPAWDVQISAPAWGANLFVPDLSPEYLGDDSFRLMAHHGINGLLIYGDLLCYATGTRFPELEHPDAPLHLETLRAASERALSYGIRLYFCAVGPKLRADHRLFERLPSARGARLSYPVAPDQQPLHCLCSSDEAAVGFHTDVVGNVCRAAPALGGLIAIIGGESYYHCFMHAADAEKGHTNCPTCAARLEAGEIAEDVVAGFLAATTQAAPEAAPECRVMAWPYSAQFVWSQDTEQLALIDRLPAEVAFLSEVDKDQRLQKDGYSKAIWDYSIDFIGPSDRVVAQALRCARRERELFIKTETAQGIELLGMPYVPCIGRLARKWGSVRALRPRGVLQSWGFFGVFDSPAERIGYEACWNPRFAPATTTSEVARRLVGEAAPALVRAWSAFDRAVSHIPVLTLGLYYIGPMFLGPAHPLPVWKGDTPEVFRGSLPYLVESDETFSRKQVHVRGDLVLSGSHQILQGWNGPEITPQLLEREFAQARDLACEGWNTLCAIEDAASNRHQSAELLEQRAMGEFLYRTLRTTLNVLRWIRGCEEPIADEEALREVARDELQNALEARRVYETAPWLNLQLRLDGGFPDSLVMIEEKIRLLNDYLNGSSASSPSGY